MLSVAEVLLPEGVPGSVAEHVLAPEDQLVGIDGQGLGDVGGVEVPTVDGAPLHTLPDWREKVPSLHVKAAVPVDGAKASVAVIVFPFRVDGIAEEHCSDPELQLRVEALQSLEMVPAEPRVE